MRAKISILFICLLAFAGTALAQTPDGEPPSVETDCDMESGAAFGLCNAYCEAMDCDCDPDDPVEPCTPNANPNACERVEGNFFKKTGREISCAPVAVDCPCSDNGAWNDTVTNATTCWENTDDRKVVRDDFGDWASVDIAESQCQWGQDAGDGSLGDPFITISLDPDEVGVCADLLPLCP